jgi:hypothetical protein
MRADEHSYLLILDDEGEVCVWIGAAEIAGHGDVIGVLQCLVDDEK